MSITVCDWMRIGWDVPWLLRLEMPYPSTTNGLSGPRVDFNSNTFCCMAEASVRDQKSGFTPTFCCRLHESAPRDSKVIDDVIETLPLSFFGGGVSGFRGERVPEQTP